MSDTRHPNWLALGQFVMAVIRPLPSAVGWYFNVPSSFLTLLFGFFAGAKAGHKGATPGHSASAFTFWPWGVVGLLVAALLLLFLAGVRLQVEKVRASQFDVSLEILPPAQAGQSDRESQGVQPWNEGVLLTNNGPGGIFRASLDSHVTGIAHDSYGQGSPIAWEGTREPERHLARGESANLRFIRSYATPNGSRFLRFWVPPSPHSGSDGRYLVGTELLMLDQFAEFSLRVIDVERDVSVVKRFSITITDSGRPTLIIEGAE